MNLNNYEFKGYSPKAHEFFGLLEKNNNRDWFQKNKIDYESLLKEPSKALVSTMSQVFATNGLRYIADVKKSMFRVNRDTRFSKNKDPYKTNMGIFFPYSISQTSTTPVETPGIYLHFDNKETFIAGGIHMPSSPALKAIRTRISEDWEILNKIINAKSFKKEFPIIFNNESLVRMPLGFPADHPAESLLKLKGYTVFTMLDFKDLYSGNLINILMKKAQVMSPLNEFFSEALSL